MTVLYQSAVSCLPSGALESSLAPGAAARAHARMPTWESPAIDIPDTATRIKVSLALPTDTPRYFWGNHLFSVNVGAWLEMAGAMRQFFAGFTEQGGSKPNRTVAHVAAPLPFVCRKCNRVYQAFDVTHLRSFGHDAEPYLPARRNVVIKAGCVDSLVVSEITVEVS